MSNVYSCECCGVNFNVTAATCGDCVSSQETWQQMAERLGVEVRKQMIKQGAASCVKGSVSVHAVPRRKSIEMHTGPLNHPQQARDLSDCLQVAARYLEEMGLND